MEMLEHVPRPGVHRAGLRHVGEALWLGCFSRRWNRNPKSFLFAIVGAEYVLNLLPKGTHEFAKFIKPSELAQPLPRCGTETCKPSKGLQYNPITRRYWLDGNTSVNYMMGTQKAA